MSTVLTVSKVSTVSASYSAVLPPSLVIFCVCDTVLHLTLQALIVTIYSFTGSFSRPKFHFQKKKESSNNQPERLFHENKEIL